MRRLPRALATVPLLVLAAPGCSTTVKETQAPCASPGPISVSTVITTCATILFGEIVFDPPPASLDKAVIDVSVYEYDPFLADGDADLLATDRLLAPESSPLLYAICVPSWNDGLKHYLSLQADMNGSGTHDCPDYGNRDFNAIKERNDVVSVVLIPLSRAPGEDCPAP
ncbi:hypothetical protein [Chondromyces apiculatus]|uniref:Lipoprotein n=1 Tax=Chondromyces apiculatus DSM 436 TaxID=1192034 RepID=A0A017SZ08_9BACT|nr:hypothetical protein [Chondromyces apiculatus]EYF01521.1 Hypothetical protein CAP_8082 [Chondromyces apiculatus DSM 436]